MTIKSNYLVYAFFAASMALLASVSNNMQDLAFMVLIAFGLPAVGMAAAGAVKKVSAIHKKHSNNRLRKRMG